jgi:hypothetical protein
MDGGPINVLIAKSLMNLTIMAKSLTQSSELEYRKTRGLMIKFTSSNAATPCRSSIIELPVDQS